MGSLSEKAILEREKNPEFRYCECKHCHIKKLCSKEDYNNDFNGIDAFICNECKEKLFSPDAK